MESAKGVKGFDSLYQTHDCYRSFLLSISHSKYKGIFKNLNFTKVLKHLTKSSGRFLHLKINIDPKWLPFPKANPISLPIYKIVLEMRK